MTDDDGGPGLMNGATLRVLGGILLGIGVSPAVLAALTVPLEVAFGDVFAELFRYGIHLLFFVAGLVVLHAVRLFFRGNWRTLKAESDGRRRERR